MSKQRIQVYADPETKRRIELAAAKHNIAVTLYCLEAIREKLTEDAVLEEERIEIPVQKRLDSDLIAELRQLREKILAERGGKLIDVDAAIEQMRVERDDELTGLR